MKKRLLLCFVLVFSLFSAGLLGAQGRSNPAGAAGFYERGRNSMAAEDWYSAAEAFLECIRLNSAHAEAHAALAECYYELGEFDEALTWVRRARTLARNNTSVANLEAVTLIALGRLDAASQVISEVLAREPYNREALYAAGELDIARGRPSEAMLRYQNALGRFPDDRRLLISLALVSGSLGDNVKALEFINRAIARHSDDYRVYYYAAYIYAQADRLSQAINYANQALRFRENHTATLSLLANLRYRNGQYNEAIQLADRLIAANREDMNAWYLKGLSLVRLNRGEEALTVLGNALVFDPNHEFIRAVLVDTLIAVTRLEDRRRSQWADWHFNRAREFRRRNLMEQSLFEYRRGLRINPYAGDRREYADLLRMQGYPARYVEELRFLRDMNTLLNPGFSDRGLNDAIENYSSLLRNALFVRWNVDPIDLNGRHWKIAVFSVAGQSSFAHADAGTVAASFLREILIHDRSIAPMNLELRQPSFSQAFRTAREAGADYFLVVSTMENERDISLRGELFVGRTGAPAGSFYIYRTGADRLRNAARGIADQLSASLPLRGKLVVRRQAQGLIDKGRADRVRVGDVYDIVKRGRSQIANNGIGLTYASDEVVGRITIESVDEEVASGTLARNGFFDRIEEGDEIIFRTAGAARSEQETTANPELRALLRTLR